MQIPYRSLIEDSRSQKNSDGQVFILSGKNKKLPTKISDYLEPWQLDHFDSTTQGMEYFQGPKGAVWIIKTPTKSSGKITEINSVSDYAWSRDQAGEIVPVFYRLKLKHIEINFYQCSSDIIHGILVGFEMGHYQFKDLRCPDLSFFLNEKKMGNDLLNKSKALGRAVNTARHLVNLPPNELNPETYSKQVQKIFKNEKSMQVTVWNEKKLKEEKCGLFLAVGESAARAPRLVHIKYRPHGVKAKSIALVGKGITFDSGGLNLKPGPGMRLMKKDMGGSATILALAIWASEVKLKKNIDFYLALAENAVDEKSSRPGDIMTARNGRTVEMHNTDAEGRLVLADTMDVAISRKDKPEILIDVATLTGAGKIALGGEIAGLFSNDPQLSHRIYQSGLETGDLCWPMPLYGPYSKMLKSHFADNANAASGFAGSITAALFLEDYVGEVKWAHLDIYAWNDSPSGALTSVGGSGQAVQCLAHYLLT